MPQLLQSTKGGPALSFVTPVRQRAEYEIKAAVDNVYSVFLDYASKRLNLAPEAMTIRNILPQTDLGASVGAVANRDVWENAVPLVLNTWTAVINFPLAVTQCVCFYGISCETVNPGVSAIRFRLGQGITLATYQLQELWCEVVATGFFPAVIVFDPTDIVRVEMLTYVAAGIAAGLQRYPLLGFTAEPRGLNAN